MMVACPIDGVQGDAHEVFHMRKWLSTGTPTSAPPPAQALSDYLFWSDCHAMMQLIRADECTMTSASFWTRTRRRHLRSAASRGQHHTA